MFKHVIPSAKEALGMHSDIMIKVFKDITEEITNARMMNIFQVHFSLPFDQMTNEGWANFQYVCNVLEEAGYEVESNEHVNTIKIVIPNSIKKEVPITKPDQWYPFPVPEMLMWAATGMNLADGLLKDLIKCCAKQIIEDKSGMLVSRYNEINHDALTSMLGVSHCVLETVLPGMANTLITSSYDNKIS